MATGDLRADGRGRHTTTNRQLLLLPGGGLFLDTPGMRELRLWESEEGLATAFDDVAAAAALCRFSDCSHEAEPDCGVRAALADGTLDAERYDSWRKLQSELRWPSQAGRRLRSEARKERRRSRSQRKALGDGAGRGAWAIRPPPTTKASRGPSRTGRGVSSAWSRRPEA